MRQQAEAALATVPPAAVAAVLPMLGVLCRTADRDTSGLLRPKEFEAAMQKSGLGISNEQVRSWLRQSAFTPLAACDYSYSIIYPFQM